jgi:hypothetical protein
MWIPTHKHIHKQDNKFGDMFTWTDYLKIIIFATVGFLLPILLAYVFAKVNPIPAVIRSFRSKRQRHRTRRISADIPLEQLEPLINHAQQPIIIPRQMYPYILPLVRRLTN